MTATHIDESGVSVTDIPKPGTIREIGGKQRVFYEDYWIRYYVPPPDSLHEKRVIIERLTRRAFHHTEGGINTPGHCLERARQTYEDEPDPLRKRVNAAMLAGALFNRATDIFTSIVDLEEKGVAIHKGNELMIQCSECFKEALVLGQQVRHFSGHEGIDELWGEPMKAFVMTMEDFFESRYIKIALTMRDLDRIAAELVNMAVDFGYDDLEDSVLEYAGVCKQIAETAKSDSDIFQIWPRYVVAREQLATYCERCSADTDFGKRMLIDDSYRLIREGKDLMTYLAGTRVPMPASLRDFLDKSEALRLRRDMLKKQAHRPTI